MLSPFRFAIVAGVSFVMFGSATPGSAQSLPFTAEDALNVRNARIEAVSLDGRWVAASVQTHRDRLDVDHFRYGDPTYVSPSLEELLLLDAESGESRSLFDERVQTSNLVWSPDGSRLAFYRYADGAYHLDVFDRESGEIRTVELEGRPDVAGGSPLEWRPDGSGFLLHVRAPGWASNARREFLALAEGPVVVQDGSDPFLDWDRVRNLGRVTVPAIVELGTGAVRELAPEGVYAEVKQSDDGGVVTLTAQRLLKTVYEGNDGAEWSVAVHDLGSGETREIIEPSTDRVRPIWGPNGDRFAYNDEGDVYVRALNDDEGTKVTPEERPTLSDSDSTRVRYSAMRWSPDGETLLLSSQLGWHTIRADGGDIDTVLELEEDEELRPQRSVVAWPPDGDHLLVSTSERQTWERGLARLDLDTGEMDALISDANLYGSWTLAEDGSRLLFTMSDGDHPNEIYAADPELRGMRKLTDLNPWLATRKLTKSELVEYLDVDGKPQKGILYYPVDYQAGQQYPLVAEIYEDFFDNGFNHRMNLLANEGWFGFRPSVEFEEGFPGEAWLKGVTAGINSLMDQGLVDGDQLGVHGTSYGGYATNLLVTQTDRFAAAINISGKVNIISFLGDSEKITTRNYRAAESGQDRIGSTLWEQPQKYLEHSAVLYADRIDTPLLLLTGEGDWNVPATNQREMYYALRRLGKEVVWVNYMKAGHGAGRAGTVSDFHDHWGRILSWYGDHFEKAVAKKAGVAEGAGGR